MSLRVCNLTKKYGRVFACDNICFSMEPGTVTVLLGPNGAGKSTLIKSVMGFLKYNGTVLIDDFKGKSVESKRLLGFVPEIPALYPNLTVAEHLEFVARAYRLENYKEYADELIDRFELSDKKKKFGDELSKGMQQKLNICCGLLPKPKYIMFDEPMIGLDPHAIKEIKNIINEIKQAGGGILISTHMIDSVDMLWDNALIMKDGKILAAVTHGELEKSGESLESIFFRLTETEDAEDAAR